MMSTTASFLGNDFIMRILAQPHLVDDLIRPKHGFANRTQCYDSLAVAYAAAENCGLNSTTSHHRSKGELWVTPARGERRFAMVYDNAGEIGYDAEEGAWPTDVWVTFAETAAENGDSTTASIDGMMCDDVRLQLKLDLVNELSGQALRRNCTTGRWQNTGGVRYSWISRLNKAFKLLLMTSAHRLMAG